MKRFSSEAWLLIGLFNSLPGRLTLENGQLKFTATNAGTLGESGLKKLEAKTGAKEVAKNLQQGKAVQLFQVNLPDVQEIVFPGIYFSLGIKITVHHQQYRVSFIQPGNTTTLQSLPELLEARKVGKSGSQ